MDHEMKTLKTKDELSDGVLITVRSVAAAADAESVGEVEGASKAKSSGVDEVGKDSCVIDIKGDGGATLGKENWKSDKICRICHLSAERPSSSEEALDLIQIGCGCKGELGFAHRHCAEAWFKLKGNRCCEICGEVAKSITGTGDSSGFMEEWSDGPVASTNSSGRREAFWCGQPFCNFLMACLVIAFVLPWFFRVNLF